MTSPSSVVPSPGSIWHYVFVLFLAACLGAALGMVRPARSQPVPRSPHVVPAQILLAVVGAIIIVVVAEDPARAFAIVGAAGLVRYRARIGDPKDAGVMLVTLAVGLTVGSGLHGFAMTASLFVIGLLWLLESFEPPARSRFELLGSTSHELHYEVTVPFTQRIRKLTRLIHGLDERHGMSVDWDIKKFKLVKP